jgi:hypothetical protein
MGWWCQFGRRFLKDFEFAGKTGWTSWPRVRTMFHWYLNILLESDEIGLRVYISCLSKKIVFISKKSLKFQKRSHLFLQSTPLMYKILF